MKNKKEIKQYSEKVCNILEEEPPYIIRWGTSILIAIFLILLLILCFTPYSYSEKDKSIFKHLLI